jgi:hypothetical protein
MKEIFEYIYNENIERIAEGRISFAFDYFDIVFELSDTDIDDEILDNYSENPPVSKIDFSLFLLNDIKCVLLRTHLYIEKYYDREISVTCGLYDIIRKIKTKYPDSILEYNTGNLFVEQVCNEWGCPDYGWYYGFEIQINTKYWNDVKFYNFLISINSPNFLIPDFYNTRKELRDTFELKILNSNTKIRRLGYLKILLKMLNEQTKIPIAKMNAKFEKYCQDYEGCRKAHKNTKGNVIVTKTGNSANPYIELALSLGLIHKAAGVYQIGKTGKVYNVLKNKIDNTNENPFEFSQFDTTFFLELLLKEDYWFLYAILEQAAITPNIAYKTLKKDFKQVLLKQISQFIDEAQSGNSKKVLPLKLIERRINEWKKPEIYMEHVLMPRLNWLYDMEFIELKNDLSFNLTATGEKLLYNLAVWNDIALHKLVSPTAYIDNYFMKMINFVFDFQKEMWTQNSNTAFEEYIEDSFGLFKTLAPNRVTFSLCSNYTKQMLFWNNKGIVDTENIKKVFEGKQISGYIYKYQEHYKDGYIQKINRYEYI